MLRALRIIRAWLGHIGPLGVREAWTLARYEVWLSDCVVRTDRMPGPLSEQETRDIAKWALAISGEGEGRGNP